MKKHYQVSVINDKTGALFLRARVQAKSEIDARKTLEVDWLALQKIKSDKRYIVTCCRLPVFDANELEIGDYPIILSEYDYLLFGSDYQQLPQASFHFEYRKCFVRVCKETVFEQMHTRVYLCRGDETGPKQMYVSGDSWTDLTD